MSKIIGIDLGTTNSLVAVWEDGESRLIANAFGEYLTPSVVSVDEDGTIYVGKIAKERLVSHPELTACSFKRYMGTGKVYRLGRHSFRPEELSAMVLRKLKEDAEHYLGETVEEAIISVPAYFNDISRNATKRAGQLAGLKVERIINEPSAAALACRHLQNQTDATMMVFDFGGGTLDVSLVECFDNVIEILAVSGDNHLGGQDFDEAIAGYFAEKMNLNPGELQEGTWQVIKEAAETCKRELTDNKSAVMRVNCPDVQGELEIARKELVEICADLFERIKKPVRQVLADTGMTMKRLNQIILVGGSCKMKLVQQYLQYLCEREDIVVVDPDHMIALGTGVYAGIKERQEDVKDLLITDICPFSMGVNVINRNKPGKNYMSFVIQRNSPLPISREASYFNAYDGQKKVSLNIYQGEGMYTEDNQWLGRMDIDIPPLPEGQAEIRVRFTYDINGVLEVETYVPLLQEKKKLLIINKELQMTAEETEERVAALEKLKIHPLQDEENKYAMELGMRLFAQCSGELRAEIAQRLQYFERVMQSQEPYRIQKARKHLMVFLAYIEFILGQNITWQEKEESGANWYQDEDDEEEEKEYQEWKIDD